MAKLNWNKNKAQGAKSTYGAIPKGCYMMTVKSSSIKSSDTKELLTIKVMVEEGPYKGRFVFPRFNIRNPSQQAEAISHMLLGNLAESVGIDELDDTDQLNGQRFYADVSVVPPKNGFGESNDIVKYYPLQATKTTKDVIKEEMQKDDGEGDFEYDFSGLDFEQGESTPPWEDNQQNETQNQDDSSTAEVAEVESNNSTESYVAEESDSSNFSLDEFDFKDDIPF